MRANLPKFMSKKRKISFEKFLLLMQEVWGELYDDKEPEAFNYSSGKIEIFCNKSGHGWFTKGLKAKIELHFSKPIKAI